MIYSAEAQADLDAIVEWTERYWGADQAEEYYEFLKTCVKSIELHEVAGDHIDEFSHIFSYVATWPKARNGHRICYLWSDNQVVVIRILHTAMDYFRHL